MTSTASEALESVRSVQRYDDGFLETWDLPDGTRHRLDGPAMIRRSEYDELHVEEWWIEGQVSRLGGLPAESFYTLDRSRLISEEWVEHGKRHRVDGPAYVTYGFDGEVESESYAIEGAFYRGWDELVAAFDFRVDAEVSALLATSALAPLLDDVATGFPRPGSLASGVREVVGVLRTGVRTVEGIRAVLGGAPVEWARSFEAGAEDR